MYLIALNMAGGPVRPHTVSSEQLYLGKTRDRNEAGADQLTDDAYEALVRQARMTFTLMAVGRFRLEDGAVLGVWETEEPMGETHSSTDPIAIRAAAEHVMEHGPDHLTVVDVATHNVVGLSPAAVARVKEAW